MADAAPRPDAVCDGGDLDCGSGLLLIIRSAMAPLHAGQVLEVRSRELSVKEDLPAWCRMVGHALLVMHDDGRQQSYLLRKKAADATLAQDLQQARDHVWQVRARWSGGMLAKASARNHGFAVGQPASFDTDDQAPSAIEYLLAALAGALTTGLQWRLSRQGIEVRQLEVVARGTCSRTATRRCARSRSRSTSTPTSTSSSSTTRCSRPCAVARSRSRCCAPCPRRSTRR
jgi:TusA-related sulfurtransferase/uncharacterized OsmC-like protein